MQPLQIATIEDLVQVLDEHPQWLEAVRTRLLTRELLELPQRIAEFEAATDRRFEAIERRFEAIDRRFEAIDRRFDVLERQISQIRTDIAPLKAAHARVAATREADLIAEEQGLSFVATLDQDQIRKLVRSADTSGISKHDLRSFRLADMMLRATDPAGEECYVAAGEECYVAVEVSYTANGRDTARAGRNALFLTRFTGRRAYAVVAGLRFDERIRASVESGEVSWFQLDPEVLEVD